MNKKKEKNFFIVKVLVVAFIAATVVAVATYYKSDSSSEPKDNGTNKTIKKNKKTSSQKVATNTKKIDNIKVASQKVINKTIDYGKLNGLFKPDGKNKYVKYRNQLNVLKSLKTPISAQEIESLRDYVLTGENDKLGLHVKDVIFIQLEKNPKANKEHIEFLTAISKDKSIDGDLRGYSVQHLRSEYAKADSELRKQIQKTLFESLKDTESDVSGTAMLALSDLSKMYPNEFDKEAINNELVSLVEDDSMHIPSRIAMVQSVGTMKNDSESVANAVRDLAFNDPGDMVLRLTAIATLGEIGTKEDVQSLEKVLKSGHKLYKVATQNAIKKLKNKTK